MFARSREIPFVRVHRQAFTLVELLVVLVVLAVLAAIVLPRFADSGRRSKEAALKADLRIVRGAIEAFHADTGLYPVTLTHLTATSAPAKGMDSRGNLVSLNPAEWHGPYLDQVPDDAVSGKPFVYGTDPSDAGTVKSSATGVSANDGSSLADW